MNLDQLVAEALDAAADAIEDLKKSVDAHSLAYYTAVANHHQTRAPAFGQQKIVTALSRLESAIVSHK